MTTRPADHPQTPDTHRGSSASPSSGLADDLLVAAGRGDQDAFAAFYDLTASQVFGLLRGVLGDTSRAENTTTGVYVQMWASAACFDPATGPSAHAVLMLTARRALATYVLDILTQPCPTSSAAVISRPAAPRGERGDNQRGTRHRLG